MYIKGTNIYIVQKIRKSVKEEILERRNKCNISTFLGERTLFVRLRINVTFNNFSVISRLSVLLVVEARENHRPRAGN